MNVTYEAFGIFAKRNNGDVPKLVKLMGDRVFHELSPASIEASVMEMETETLMDVRRLSITVMDVVDPNRPPDVEAT